MPITHTARSDYVQNICRLSLWWAAKVRADRGDFRAALTGETPLYRLTTLWDGRHHPAHPPPGWHDAQWDDLTADLALVSDDIESIGMERLRPLLEPRIARDVADWPHIPSGIGYERDIRLHGFFLFERAQAVGETTEVQLHMGNTFAPESPFADPAARRRNLADLLDDAVDRNPRLETIVCTSWLNSFEPFLQFFPPPWRAGASAPRPTGYTYGPWGQMVARDGSFHRRNGEALRSTGRLPYPCVTCRCRIVELQAWLGSH